MGYDNDIEGTHCIDCRRCYYESNYGIYRCSTNDMRVEPDFDACDDFIEDERLKGEN